MEKNNNDNRKEEIIDACEKLYKEIGYKNVNIKVIGDNISCSRTSIYNYFETKEEIFLALVEREYIKWNKDLEKIYDSYDKLSKDELIDKIAKSLSKRKILLKLISMNMYEMKENSSFESVKKYKMAYTESVNIFRKIFARRNVGRHIYVNRNAVRKVNNAFLRKCIVVNSYVVYFSATIFPVPKLKTAYIAVHEFSRGNGIIHRNFVS